MSALSFSTRVLCFFAIIKRVWCYRCSTGRGCWAANGVGLVQRWDLAANSMGSGLRGAEGAVKAVVLHPQRRLVVTAGLDHQLRVYDSRSRALLGRVYAKQPLQCMVVLPDEQSPSTEEPSAQEAQQKGKHEGQQEGKRAARQAQRDSKGKRQRGA